MNQPAIAIAIVVVQVFFLFTLATTIWFYRMPVDWVSPANLDPRSYHDGPPPIALFYPVLNELEETMRSTLIGLEDAPYPEDRKRVIAIPNSDDLVTIDRLQRIQHDHPWLEIWPVPPTTDSSWETVWEHWERNNKSYWWHEGRRRRVRDLPPKKTRQLVWAMYQLMNNKSTSPRTLLSYIDADTIVPRDYWYAGATGNEEFDVTQTVNITGNAVDTWPTSFFAMDHIGWDASIYPHMSANGKHPYYVLGKGLFYRLTDLDEVGGFNPWLTIEDPEAGMRLWTNGRKLGIIRSALVEEVPSTWRNGYTQRKRWIAGFFQSLASPLKKMGMPLRHRLRARLNIIPVFSLIFNPVALGLAIWTMVEVLVFDTEIPLYANAISLVALAAGVPLMLYRWLLAWKKIETVVPDRRRRVKFVLRVNPISSFIYGIWWIIPITRGFVMFLLDQGQRWERTVKRDANHDYARNANSAP